MRKLIRKMIEMGIEKDLIEGVVSLLDTEEQYEKMCQKLGNLRSLSTTAILGTALLIADEE